MEVAAALCDYAEKKRRRSKKLQTLRKGEQRIDPTGEFGRAVRVPDIAPLNTGTYALKIVGDDPDDVAVDLVEHDARPEFKRLIDPEVIDEHVTTTWYRVRQPGDKVVIAARVPLKRLPLFQALGAAISNLDVVCLPSSVAVDGRELDTEKTKARTARTLIDFLCSFEEVSPPSGIELAAIAVAAGIEEATDRAASQIDLRGEKWRKKKNAVRREVELLLQYEAKRKRPAVRKRKGEKKRGGPGGKTSHY